MSERVQSDTDRVAAVNAFANRVADYIATSTPYDEWAKRRVAVEAVTVAMGDAWYEVERIAAMTEHPEPDAPPYVPWGAPPPTEVGPSLIFPANACCPSCGEPLKPGSGWEGEQG